METIRAYTSIEQSKKLAEILPLESADACWTNHLFGSILSSWRVESTPPQEYKSLLDRFAVRGYLIEPAWSLSALLQLLPLGIYDELDGYDYELEIKMIDKMPRYIRLGDIYHSQFPYDFEKDTLLDNIVESIIWLNDNNYKF